MIKINYISAGSYGIVLKEDTDNITYKITSVILDGGYVDLDNVIESIFLNLFNELIFILENNKINREKCIFKINLMQNISTEYMIPKELETIFDIDLDTMNFIKKKFNLRLEDSGILFSSNTNNLIVNKMKYFKYSIDLISKNTIYCRQYYKEIIKNIIIAIAPIHQNDFIHGDLKNQNILLNTYDDLVVTDLGSIRSIYSETYVTTCTITTRSPEDLMYEYSENQEYINWGFRTDIWSLGLIFLELLIGYNPILMIYNNFKLINKTEELIEKKILNFYKSLDYINPETYIEDNISINMNLCKVIKVIKSMLFIKPEMRTNSIFLIYNELFDEPFPFNYKINFDYKYIHINKEKIFDLRKKIYPKIIDICNLYNKVYLLPNLLDLMDRYLNKIIFSDESIGIEFELEFENITISAIFIMLGFFNYKYYDISSIKKYFSNNFSLLKLNENIKKILVELNYDIYRPFNIYNCTKFNKLCVNYLKKNISDSDDSSSDDKVNNCISCDVINKNNIQIKKIFYIRNFKDKNKLVSIIKTMIDTKYIGATPEYYYNKLITED